jgi:hypothetical protein
VGGWFFFWIVVWQQNICDTSLMSTSESDQEVDTADRRHKLLDEQRLKRQLFMGQWREDNGNDSAVGLTNPRPMTKEQRVRSREQAANWRKENPEKLREHAAKRNRNNLTSEQRAWKNERLKSWRHANRDKVSAQNSRSKKRRNQRCASDPDFKADVINKRKEYVASNRLVVSWRTYRAGARARGLVWELTKAQHKQLVQSPCHYCGKQATELELNGIDRVDNNVGYMIGNCEPCCTRDNFMKMAQSKAEFLAACQAIALHSFKGVLCSPSEQIAMTM